jgi:putative acyl-CoA dehydrogenase
MKSTCCSRKSALTHQVFNQSSSLLSSGMNFFSADPALLQALNSIGVASNKQAIDLLTLFGSKCGSIEYAESAIVAEKNRPVLRQFDEFGRRIDVVDYHQSYHDLLRLGLENGTVAYGFSNLDKVPYSHIIRAALLYMENQLEPGN